MDNRDHHVSALSNMAPLSSINAIQYCITQILRVLFSFPFIFYGYIMRDCWIYTTYLSIFVTFFNCTIPLKCNLKILLMMRKWIELSLNVNSYFYWTSREMHSNKAVYSSNLYSTPITMHTIRALLHLLGFGTIHLPISYPTTTAQMEQHRMIWVNNSDISNKKNKAQQNHVNISCNVLLKQPCTGQLYQPIFPDYDPLFSIVRRIFLIRQTSPRYQWLRRLIKARFLSSRKK